MHTRISGLRTSLIAAAETARITQLRRIMRRDRRTPPASWHRQSEDLAIAGIMHDIRQELLLLAYRRITFGPGPSQDRFRAYQEDDRVLVGQAYAGVRRGRGRKSAVVLMAKLRATSVSCWLLLRA
jgi:hypothetical protein